MEFVITVGYKTRKKYYFPSFKTTTVHILKEITISPISEDGGVDLILKGDPENWPSEIYKYLNYKSSYDKCLLYGFDCTIGKMLLEKLYATIGWSNGDLPCIVDLMDVLLHHLNKIDDYSKMVEDELTDFMPTRPLSMVEKMDSLSGFAGWPEGFGDQHINFIKAIYSLANKLKKYTS